VLVQVVLQLSFLISCLVLIPFPENFVDPRGVVQPRGGGKARADVGEERVCEAVDVDAVHFEYIRKWYSLGLCLEDLRCVQYCMSRSGEVL